MPSMPYNPRISTEHSNFMGQRKMTAMIRKTSVLVLVVLSLFVASCRKRSDSVTPPANEGDANRPAPAAAGSLDSTEGLKRYFEDLLAALKAGDKDKAAAMTKDLVLPNPDAWFKQTFGEEAGARVAAEYAGQLPQIESGLLPTLQGCLKKNQTDVRVTRLDNPGDAEAVGNQKRALEMMKVKTPLYSVRLVAPGQPHGYHLYSFAYIDGGFRILGKMTALK